MLIGINRIGNATAVQAVSCSSVTLSRNPAVAGLLISALHSRPGDPVGGPFALLGVALLIAQESVTAEQIRSFALLRRCDSGQAAA